MTPGPGAVLGTYRVERLLGRGGMGTVFLAHDTTLDRRVALKLVESPAGTDDARARVLREARNAAALNHPNICTIHEVGEADGSAFIAMEYVDGEPLNERLAAGPLGLAEVLTYGQQAADALAFAHDRGVIHRDLKAANAIVSTAGRLKIVDFGLARRATLPDGTATTIVSLAPGGLAIGTPYAMAPEQARGQPADERTDIWALGVLLYEMASGVKPFGGSAAADVFSSILRDRPAPLPDTVPHALAVVIDRCLAKEPADRYQRAIDVHGALEQVDRSATRRMAQVTMLLTGRRAVALTAALVALVTAALVAGILRSRFIGPATNVVRLAVLPFENLTGDPDQEYFSDGLTEDMITQLGRLAPERLSVIARTSSMRYKKSDKPIDQIGRELHVDYLLEGSARREADRIRVNATLISVSDQTQRWAESYERDLAGILNVQGDVARGVARSLSVALLPAEQRRLANPRAVNAAAYTEYMQGQAHAQKLTRPDLETALHYFDRALQHDQNFALAYAGIARVWGGRRQMGFVSAAEATPRAAAAIVKALALDDTLAEGHAGLAAHKAYGEYDWRGADVEYRRALDLDPNLTDAMASYSHVLQALGRPNEAMAQIRRALDVDPFNANHRAFYGVDLVFVRQYDEAVVQFRKALETSPNLPFAQIQLANALHMKGARAESLAVMRAQAAAGGDRESEEALTRGDAEGGYVEAMRRSADVLAARSRSTNAAAVRVASLYMRAGDTDRALEWLDHAVAGGDPNVYGAMSPMWDGIRSNPRFKSFLRRINLP
jgi:serine/threonine-protein kinase